MNLYTNGCSWTWGGGLGLEKEDEAETRLSSVWPHHLGKLLNCENVYNLSIGCGSNDRILRTTFDWLVNTEKEILDSTVAVIQWTEPSRYEFYSPIDRNDPYENISNQWALCKPACILLPTNICEEVEYHLDVSDRFLANNTEIQNAYKLLFQVEALSSLFKQYNIKYLYWTNGFHLPALPEPIKNQLLKQPWIVDSTSWEYERVSKKDLHPGFIGHKQIAEFIYNHLQLSKTFSFTEASC